MGFKLPSTRSIRNYLSNIDMRPGISSCTTDLLTEYKKTESHNAIIILYDGGYIYTGPLRFFSDLLHLHTSSGAFLKFGLDDL